MIFLNSASSAAALVFYLPCVCTHTNTEGEQRKARVRNVLKCLEKTQYLVNTLYHVSNIDKQSRIVLEHPAEERYPCIKYRKHNY